MKVGILAFQGAVEEHARMVARVGAEPVAVRRKEQLAELDGLILPGGESTTIGKLMRVHGLLEAIREFASAGKPVFGTCAGLILMADRISGQEEAHLRLMDMTVSRNAFGRQRESFETDLDVKGFDSPMRAVFIRAPWVEEVGPGVDVLAVYGGRVVAARQGHLLAAAFHPELTDDVRMHELFLDMIQENREVAAEPRPV
ncbi:MAG: glutamine amidotransferase subunit PdxT [Candidatus Reconcilbacillus cellulovorans]|uniref:Pyridoxal 5'-phosphate synthase subunit PdxT n=1 Tax=Candidatus Reconcilbacillus cellulovorans TaxID=1906605 RepID=A0A2A6E092_9BACL|nr:MAG: glutamine amidotransferase subunit PdxT [Candidatus Reconcilbacillus cellulovorans]